MEPRTGSAALVDERTCLGCVHFVDDPGAIEAEFPGIAVFGSAFASCRGHAGICQQRDRFMDPIPAAICPTFQARGASHNRLSG